MYHARNLICRRFVTNCTTSINGKPWDISLAIIKPDAYSHPFVRKSIHKMIMENNMFLVRSKSCLLSLEDAMRFYQIHRERFFYNRLVTFMSSGPIAVYILTGDDVIQNWRNLMGPTKSFRAQFDAPKSIRGLFGLTDTRNSTHGSDSLLSAIQEAKFFFPQFNFEIWLQESEPHFRFNRVFYDERTQQHQVKTH